MLVHLVRQIGYVVSLGKLFTVCITRQMLFHLTEVSIYISGTDNG